MKKRDADWDLRDRKQRLIDNLDEHVPAMQRRAIELDRAGEFPAVDIALLRDLGALAAPVPVALGGLGMGTDPDGAAALFETLRRIGRGSLAVGRLYEGHVNALRLIFRCGTDAQARGTADDSLAGRLFGLWVTDPPDAPLSVTASWQLRGDKAPCSGAGHASRALVTGRLPDGNTYMLVVRPPEGAVPGGWDMHGMRGTASGRVRFGGIEITRDAVIGSPGDYLRQPDFSAGAWRTSAVTLGGLEALVAMARDELAMRGRDGDPHQRARIGQALIAQETARLWVWRAAQLGEGNAATPEDVANYVNLARLAAEAACLDAIRLVQRSLGLPAFRRGALSELLFRDLGLYLRQPAPDETLTEAAGHFMRRELPSLPAS